MEDHILMPAPGMDGIPLSVISPGIVICASHLLERLAVRIFMELGSENTLLKLLLHHKRPPVKPHDVPKYGQAYG